MSDPTKPWVNQDPSDKNLEALKNGFALENIMQSNILTDVPALTDLQQGQFRMVYTGGVLYKYTRMADTLHRIAFTAV